MLLETYDDICHEPEPVLRQKRYVAPGQTDISIFSSLVVKDYDDLWPDADLWGVYKYLKNNKRLRLSAEWSCALEDFETEVDAVSRLHYAVHAYANRYVHYRHIDRYIYICVCVCRVYCIIYIIVLFIYYIRFGSII